MSLKGQDIPLSAGGSSEEKQNSSETPEETQATPTFLQGRDLRHPRKEAREIGQYLSNIADEYLKSHGIKLKLKTN